MQPMSKPPRWRLFISFLRTFAIDNLFNERNMQNLGFAYSMAPILRWLNKDDEKYYEALRRYMGYFRTNNFFLPIILGATIHLETENKIDQIKTLKSDMMASVSALGDDLIYATAQPLVISLAMVSIFVPRSAYIIIPSVFLIYLIANYALRFKLFSVGVREGINIMMYIINLNLKHVISLLKSLTVVLFGAMIAFFMEMNIDTTKEMFHIIPQQGAGYWESVIVAQAVTIVLILGIYLAQRRTKPIFTFYVIVLMLLFGYFIFNAAGVLL